MFRRCCVVAIATLVLFVGACGVSFAAGTTYTLADETSVSPGGRGTFTMSCGTDRMIRYKVTARHIAWKPRSTRTGISIDYVGHMTEEQTLLVQLTCQPAKSSTYQVTGQVTLAYVNGAPSMVPRQPDDELTVICKSGDTMTGYAVNDPALVRDSWRHIGGSGITVAPAFAEKTAVLKVAITCQRT
jgi:hypothetical protein